MPCRLTVRARTLEGEVAAFIDDPFVGGSLADVPVDEHQLHLLLQTQGLAEIAESARKAGLELTTITLEWDQPDQPSTHSGWFSYGPGTSQGSTR
jgi:hypothetical protein